MEYSRNIPIFNIPGTLFENILRNFKGTFFRMFREYIRVIFHEYSANIYFPGGQRPLTVFAKKLHHTYTSLAVSFSCIVNKITNEDTEAEVHK